MLGRPVEARDAAGRARHLGLALLVEHYATHRCVLLRKASPANCSLTKLLSFLLSFFDDLALVEHLIDQVNQAILVMFEPKVGHILVNPWLSKARQLSEQMKIRNGHGYETITEYLLDLEVFRLYTADSHCFSHPRRVEIKVDLG